MRSTVPSMLLLVLPMTLFACGGEDKADSQAKMSHGHGHGGNRQAPTSPLVPGAGDHIVVVGNTFAERMDHFGHFETLLHDAYPDHELVVRNLGWSGDTPSLQPRPLDFGTMEEHLLEQKADVIIACFGMNESFDGDEGRPAFEESLREFIASMRDLKPGGSEPEIVLVSPIAHEDVGGDLPDGNAHNPDLASYTESIRMVADEQGVRFVDLHAPTSDWEGNGSLTINGIHVNELGDRITAEHMYRDVFDPGFEGADWSGLDPLRAAVIEKNRQFFYRYRPINSYYVMGGRKNPFGVVNFPAEMEKLDGMIARRDDRIWTLASGESVPDTIDDSSTRSLDPIVTNYDGPPIVYRDPADSRAGFTLPDGYEATCFASEIDFPVLQNPVSMTFDEQGRLWVLAIPTYPQYLPGVEPEDKLLILEDNDGDGRADTCTVFAEGLHVPTGFELGDGGAYVSAQPNLVFLEDTDGDDRADRETVVLHGFGTEDSHHAISAHAWGPGGGLYFQEGTFHHSQVETPHGPVRVKNGAVFRWEPRTGKLRVHVSYAFANPWGHVFDGWGQDYVADASPGTNYFGAMVGSKMSYDRKHRGVSTFNNAGIRPTGGCEVVSSEHLGEDLQGDYLLTNVITLRGIRQHDLSADGAGVKARHQHDLLTSDDPVFRPTDLQVGPDGALWFVDWYNPLIGHMQHSLRDPNRDHEHGRIWRITRTGAPLSTPVDVSSMTTIELLRTLEHPERRTRDRARLALRGQPTEEVAVEARAWLDEVDPSDPDREHHVLEALWVMQNHDRVDADLLRRVLGSDDPRARAAAVRVLSAWYDRVPDAKQLLLEAARDEQPRVRLEAAVAGSWRDDIDGTEVVLEVANSPTDVAIDHVLEQSMIELAPQWTSALQSGWPYAEANPDAIDDLLVSVSTDDLLEMQGLPAVHRTVLRRSDAPAARRRESLDAVSGHQGVAPGQTWLSELNDEDAMVGGRSREMGRLVPTLSREELQSLMPGLRSSMSDASKESTRRSMLAGVMIAEDDVETSWSAHSDSEAGVMRWMGAARLLPDGALRDNANRQVTNLLVDPMSWNETNGGADAAVRGRYVRIDLPGTEPLTLAEVEVHSKGRNIAMEGTATQSSTGWGGVASRAIDGDADGTYGSGHQSHTAEGKQGAWWEVDLGDERSIDAITIHNRQEAPYWNRIDGYSVTILDGDRGVAWERTDQPPNQVRMEHVMNDDPAPRIRRAALAALAGGGAVEWSDALGDAVYTMVEPIPIANQQDPVLVDAMSLGNRVPELGKRLAGMHVPVIEITSAPYRMEYDLKEFTVEAGKPVRIRFTNPDDKPHNLVIGTPGSLREIGRRATLLGTTTRAVKQHYVPSMRQILFWMPVAEPGQVEELIFVAPDEPGDYVYVCTYPGHWSTMNGIMKVKASSP